MALCREELVFQLLESPPAHDNDDQFKKVGVISALNDMSEDLLTYVSRLYAMTDDETWAFLADKVTGWFNHANMLEFSGCPDPHEHTSFELLYHAGEQQAYRDWANEAMSAVSEGLAA